MQSLRTSNIVPASIDHLPCAVVVGPDAVVVAVVVGANVVVVVVVGAGVVVVVVVVVVLVIVLVVVVVADTTSVLDKNIHTTYTVRYVNTNYKENRLKYCLYLQEVCVSRCIMVNY